MSPSLGGALGFGVPPFQCLRSMGSLSPASSLLGACFGIFSPPIHMPPPYMGAMGSLSPASPSPRGGYIGIWASPHSWGLWVHPQQGGALGFGFPNIHVPPPFCSQRPRKRMPVARNTKTLSTKQPRAGKGAPITENVAPEKVRPGWETGGPLTMGCPLRPLTLLCCRRRAARPSGPRPRPRGGPRSARRLGTSPM